MNIRRARIEDAESIRNIYNYYVRETVITFDLKEKSEAEFTKEFEHISGEFPYLVGGRNNKIVGYIYVSAWKSRCAYDYTVETSIYLHPEETGKGYGIMLYEALFAVMNAEKIHTVIAGISLPNDGSVALHEKLGFEKIAHFKEVGYKFDRWIDVGYWERILPFDPMK